MSNNIKNSNKTIDTREFKGNACLVDFQDLKSPPVAEIKALLQDLGYNVVQVFTFHARNRRFLGKGQLQMVGDFVTKYNDEMANDTSSERCLVVYNNTLSGLNYKVLEGACKTSVLSRIDIIIEIFENRAMTVEAKLQIRLAKALHQKTKLLKLWSHLERQGGGGSYTAVGGPGETQYELDRRMLEDSVADIKRKLAKIKSDSKTRQEARKDKVVALVGYSNAGKSSLFNKLANGDAKVSPKPFETLDPFMRQLVLSNHQKIILSDTVGFVSFLPPFLIQAFRSTLENIAQADLILFVIDSSIQPYNLNEVLNWLKILKVLDRPLVYVWNKVDLISDEQKRYIGGMELDAVQVSSVTGEGVKALLSRIETGVSEQVRVHVRCNLSKEQDAYQWLFKNSMPTEQQYDDETFECYSLMSNENYNRFVKLFNVECKLV